LSTSGKWHVEDKFNLKERRKTLSQSVLSELAGTANTSVVRLPYKVLGHVGKSAKKDRHIHPRKYFQEKRELEKNSRWRRYYDFDFHDREHTPKVAKPYSKHQRYNRKKWKLTDFRFCI
jgi:hypothetical protein